MHSFAVISRCLLSFFKIWLLYLFSSIFAQAPCYYPGGDLQTADTPCNPGELHSMCCNRRDICLSNGLCFETFFNSLNRGSCTDQSWSSESCSKLCRDRKRDGGRIFLCPGSNPYEWYCGASNVGSCTTTNTINGTFSLPKGFFSDFRDYRCIATTSNPSTCSIQSITPTDSNKITISSSTISSSTISSSTISSSTMRISTTNSPSPNPSLLQTCQTNSPLPIRPPKNSATIQIGIGAGVGIPLLLSLVASLLFLFRERRIRKQLAIEYERSNERAKFHDTLTWTEGRVPTISPVFEVDGNPVQSELM